MTARRRRFVHTLQRTSVVLALLGASCGWNNDDCPAIAYFEGVTVALRSTTWPDGLYLITLDSPAGTLSCRVPVAQRGSAWTPASEPASCASSSNALEPLPVDIGRDLRLRYARDVPTLTVRIERDGLVLHDAPHTLTYVDDYPDGEDCGRVRTAKLDIMLP